MLMSVDGLISELSDTESKLDALIEELQTLSDNPDLDLGIRMIREAVADNLDIGGYDSSKPLMQELVDSFTIERDGDGFVVVTNFGDGADIVRSCEGTSNEWILERKELLEMIDVGYSSYQIPSGDTGSKHGMLVFGGKRGGRTRYNYRKNGPIMHPGRSGTDIMEAARYALRRWEEIHTAKINKLMNDLKGLTI